MRSEPAGERLLASASGGLRSCARGAYTFCPTGTVVFISLRTTYKRAYRWAEACSNGRRYEGIRKFPVFVRCESWKTYAFWLIICLASRYAPIIFINVGPSYYPCDFCKRRLDFDAIKNINF